MLNYIVKPFFKKEVTKGVVTMEQKDKSGRVIIFPKPIVKEKNIDILINEIFSEFKNENTYSSEENPILISLRDLQKEVLVKIMSLPLKGYFIKGAEIYLDYTLTQDQFIFFQYKKKLIESVLERVREINILQVQEDFKSFPEWMKVVKPLETKIYCLSKKRKEYIFSTSFLLNFFLRDKNTGEIGAIWHQGKEVENKKVYYMYEPQV